MFKKIFDLIFKSRKKNKENNDIINMNCVKQMTKKFSKPENTEVIKQKKECEFTIEYHEFEKMFYPKYKNKYLTRKIFGEFELEDDFRFAKSHYTKERYNETEEQARKLIEDYKKFINKKVITIHVE